MCGKVRQLPARSPSGDGAVGIDVDHRIPGDGSSWGWRWSAAQSGAGSRLGMAHTAVYPPCRRSGRAGRQWSPYKKNPAHEDEHAHLRNRIIPRKKKYQVRHRQCCRCQEKTESRLPEKRSHPNACIFSAAATIFPRLISAESQIFDIISQKRPVCQQIRRLCAPSFCTKNSVIFRSRVDTHLCARNRIQQLAARPSGRAAFALRK